MDHQTSLIAQAMSVTVASVPMRRHPSLRIRESLEVVDEGRTALVVTEAAASSIVSPSRADHADGLSPSQPPAWDSQEAVVGLKEATRAVLALFANVTVVAGLLVYFGWRRTETHAEHLGIDVSLLDSSLRTYLLRSTGPVFTLLLSVGVVGLISVAVDRRLVPIVRSGTRRASIVLRVLGGAWLLLPAVVWALGYVWRPQCYVLFPASIGGGALVTAIYAHHLRQLDVDPDERERRRTAASRAAGALLAGVTLFWTASNYAEVLGTREARDFAQGIDRLPGAIAYSKQRLHLAAPGVVETQVGANDEDSIHYRYEGLRFAGRAGDNFYFVSNEWSSSYGVFLVVHEDEVARLDLIRTGA